MTLSAPLIRHLGRVDYEPTWRAMQAFTEARDTTTPDELWVVEHPPVYTVGVAGRAEHLPAARTPIPLVRIDRGGQITYHGPGQAVVYTLIDLARRGIKVREMVCVIEKSVIALLAEHGVASTSKPGAPGIYIPRLNGAKIGASNWNGSAKIAASNWNGSAKIAASNWNGSAKIAALGLKVRKGCCFHGVSLNVDVDLAPFLDIDPCGYPGLAVTRTADLGIPGNCAELGDALAQRISARIAADTALPCSPDTPMNDTHAHAR